MAIIEQTRLDRLLHRFGSAAQAHYAALEVMDAEAANRHALVIARLYAAIVAEKAGEQLLLTLLEDTRPAVRGVAAIYLLRHSSAAPLAVLRELSMLPGLMGFRASCAIERWERRELEGDDAP